MVRNMTVWPARRRLAASASRALPAARPSSARSASLPRATVRPSTVATTPLPVTERKPWTGARARPWCSAAAMIAAASGCSLPRSSRAARPSTSLSLAPGTARTLVTRGRPSVTVPVLSRTRVSARPSASSAAASFTSTPARAPRPTATITDIGVARPSAHGQAMISTATAFTRAWARRGSGPQSVQAAKASTAAPTTAGTNHAATRSARRWMGARLRWASPTSLTIWARRVSLPTRSARTTRPPVPLTVAPVTRSPMAFATGSGSPLIIDSSTALPPSSTTPSAGTFSPGRTRRRSGPYRLEGDVVLRAVRLEAAGGGRRQVEKGSDGPVRALARAARAPGRGGRAP